MKKEILEQLDYTDLEEIDKMIYKVWNNDEPDFFHKNREFFECVLNRLKEKAE